MQAAAADPQLGTQLHGQEPSLLFCGVRAAWGWLPYECLWALLPRTLPHPPLACQCKL